MTNLGGISNLFDMFQFTLATPAEEAPPSADKGVTTWAQLLGRQQQGMLPKNDRTAFFEVAERVKSWATTRGVSGTLKDNKLDALILPSLLAAQIPAVGGLPVVTGPIIKFKAQTPIVPGIGV